MYAGGSASSFRRAPNNGTGQAVLEQLADRIVMS